MSIKVLLVDDHEMIRLGIRSFLEGQSNIGEIEEATNGHEAILKVDKVKPDVVIMDYEMPNFNGIYATREIVKGKPDAKVLLLSMHQSRDMIIEGINAGVSGYVSKNARLPEIYEAIRSLARGGTWFKGDVAEVIAPHLLDAKRSGRKLRNKHILSDREREIVKLLASGETSASIAETLSISKHTVENHKTNIFKKLSLKNISGLTRYAIRNQIISI